MNFDPENLMPESPERERKKRSSRFLDAIRHFYGSKKKAESEQEKSDIGSLGEGNTHDA